MIFVKRKRSRFFVSMHYLLIVVSNCFELLHVYNLVKPIWKMSYPALA